MKRQEEYSLTEFILQYPLNKLKEDIRLDTLLHNNTCTKCGLRGTLWTLEYDNNYPKHFNLYAQTKKGEILMTIDHIIPKSKGGPHQLDNLQTLCFPCNLKKGNKL
jgi:5-methylcytosine-specific restriction endonuclease McrA